MGSKKQSKGQSDACLLIGESGKKGEMLPGDQGKILESKNVVVKGANTMKGKEKVVDPVIFDEEIRAHEELALLVSIENRGDPDVVVGQVEGISHDKVQDWVEAQCHDRDDVSEVDQEVLKRILLLESSEHSLLVQDRTLSGLDNPIFHAGVQEYVVTESQIKWCEVYDMTYEHGYVALCSIRDDGSEVQICSDT